MTNIVVLRKINVEDTFIFGSIFISGKYENYTGFHRMFPLKLTLYLFVVHSLRIFIKH